MSMLPDVLPSKNKIALITGMAYCIEMTTLNADSRQVLVAKSDRILSSICSIEDIMSMEFPEVKSHFDSVRMRTYTKVLPLAIWNSSNR
jgi:hypothetical protein